jgi:hypothetical protein
MVGGAVAATVCAAKLAGWTWLGIAGCSVEYLRGTIT